jgi:rhodanese-related sulfurtransferase
MNLNQLIEFSTRHSLLVLALVAILAMLIADTVRRKLSGVTEIEPRQATRLLNTENAIMVDFRGDKEYRGGHIANAVLLDNAQDIGKKLDKVRGKPLIVYCNSGQRSVGLCSKLRKQGFENVYNLKGGIMAWQKADLPVTKS